MTEELSALAAALHAAKHFEQAALATLRALLRMAEQELEASGFAGRGGLLRAVVHLRPAEAYSRLVALEREAMERLPPGEGSLRWRMGPRRRCGLRLRLASGGGARLCRLHRRGPGHAASPTRSRPAASPRRRCPATSFTSGEPAAVAEPPGHTRVRHPAADARRPYRRDDRPGGELHGGARPGVHLAARWAPGCRLRRGSGGPLPHGPAAAPGRRAGDGRVPARGRRVHGQPVSSPACLRLAGGDAPISGPTGAASRGWRAGATQQLARASGPLRGPGPPDGARGAADGGALRMDARAPSPGRSGTTPARVARAEGGTLFIDEIDKLSLKAQAGLLHVLEERAYRPLGDGAERARADVRFIVGTNANLREAVRAGQLPRGPVLPHQRPARAAAAAGRAAGRDSPPGRATCWRAATGRRRPAGRRG